MSNLSCCFHSNILSKYIIQSFTLDCCLSPANSPFLRDLSATSVIWFLINSFLIFLCDLLQLHLHLICSYTFFLPSPPSTSSLRYLGERSVRTVPGECISLHISLSLAVSLSIVLLLVLRHCKKLGALLPIFLVQLFIIAPAAEQSKTKTETEWERKREGESFVSQLCR